MRNILKATTLENRFPLLAVEEGCILSKDADITVAFQVELPELYTVTSAEYAAIHSAWVKAIKVLPTYSVVHKQDWFVKEDYRPDLQKEEMSFLSRSFDRHFNERPFLIHACYLFLTKTTKNRSRQQSNFSTLCRGHIIPKEIRDKDTARKFLEATEQFDRIMNECGFVRLRRLGDEEIVGTEKKPGLIEKYFSLSLSDTTVLEDIDLRADRMRIGDKRLCLHTLSDTEDRWGQICVTSASPPTAATAAFHLPLPWVCCSRAAISTTSMCSLTTVRRTCNASRKTHGTCTRSPATAEATRSISSG